ncbi:hypothetical protein Sjap_015130 [Stephania japonica]|uniref:F-box associated beta-propeller type 3 domain-containing protein n=1 Tax=Stephania japonica TaxID=461633 RepID=A0AAP0NR36_9MAGN
MGTNSWRRILGNEEFSSEVPGKFVNGFVYWKAMYDRRNEVFCFDIHGEVFSELRLPRVVLTEDTDKIICNIEIGELGGCLALVREFADRFHTPHVYHEVWVMKENWVKMHSIDISESVWTKFPTPFIPVGSVSINKKKKYVEIVYLSSNGRLFSYNPNTNQFRSFRGHGYCNLHRAVAPYVESLVLLDGKYINEEKHVFGDIFRSTSFHYKNPSSVSSKVLQ